jgi:hypothetical protein
LLVSFGLIVFHGAFGGGFEEALSMFRNTGERSGVSSA